MWANEKRAAAIAAASSSNSASPASSCGSSPSKSERGGASGQHLTIGSLHAGTPCIIRYPGLGDVFGLVRQPMSDKRFMEVLLPSNGSCVYVPRKQILPIKSLPSEALVYSPPNTGPMFTQPQPMLAAPPALPEVGNCSLGQAILNRTKIMLFYAYVVVVLPAAASASCGSLRSCKKFECSECSGCHPSKSTFTVRQPERNGRRRRRRRIVLSDRPRQDQRGGLRRAERQPVSRQPRSDVAVQV